MLASHSLIVILSLSGGGRVTGENESGIFQDDLGELNDRGRQSRLILINNKEEFAGLHQVKLKSLENEKTSMINAGMFGDGETDFYQHFSSSSDLKFYFTDRRNNSLEHFNSTIGENILPVKTKDKIERNIIYDLLHPLDEAESSNNEYYLSSVYNPEHILSDLNTNHFLYPDYENGENYKIVFNFSSDLPYPVWVNRNSMKIASDELFKSDWKKRNFVIRPERRDLGVSGGYKKNKIRFSAIPILMKLRNVAKLIINSYRKKLSHLLRITRRYQPATIKQVLTLAALFASFLVVALL